MYNEFAENDVVVNSEPEKCSGWYWVTFKELRDQIDGLFYPLKDFLNKFPDLNTVTYLKKMIKVL
jgi:hypothetical protein